MKTFVISIAVILMLSGIIVFNDFSTDNASAGDVHHSGDSAGTWSGTDVHYIDDVVNVIWGSTLTIQAGARLFINDSLTKGKIEVQGGGKLILEGTSENPIFITSNATSPKAGDYVGIIIRNGGIAYINHTYIGNATTGINIMANTTVEVNNCLINETVDWGIKSTGEGTPRITECTINNTGNNVDVSGGICIESDSEAIIDSCEIFNSRDTGIYMSSGSPTINNTKIHNTTGNGIRIMGSSTPIIKRCDISDTWKENIYVTGDTRTVLFENSTIGNWTNPAGGDILEIDNTDADHRINVTFLNTTYQKDSFTVEDYGTMLVKWHVNVYVNNTAGSPVEGARVSLVNSTLHEMDFRSTNAKGEAYYLVGIEFSYDPSGYSYDKYYFVDVSCEGFADNQTNIWIDRFNETSFQLVDNGAPVADAGPDKTVDQGDLVTFDGSGSTDNLGVDNFTWIFDDEGAHTLYGVSPNYTFNNAGAFVVNLAVKDSAGNSHADNLTVTVHDTTNPVADAGPNQTVDQGGQITFNGNGSQDNVGVVNYTWNFTDVGARMLYGEGPNYTFNNSGKFVVTLTVTDLEGNTHADIVVITVNDITNPVADAGVDRAVNQHENVTFNGSSSTDNVGVVSYTWTWNDGGTQSLSGPKPNYTFNNAGVFMVILNVSDADGNWAEDTVTITVNDTSNPEADAGLDQNVDQGDIITFDGSGSTDNVAVTNYSWTFNDGDAQTVYGLAPNYTFNNAGVFVVTLTVKDDEGNTHTNTLTITVKDTAKPVADAGSDQVVEWGFLVTLDGSGSTDNVGIINYTWNFEYNNSDISLYGEEVKFSFQVSGKYNITLMVTDVRNNSDTANFTVTVLPVEGNGDSNGTDVDVSGEDESRIWLWLLIVGLGGIIFGGLYFQIDRRRKIIEGRIKDENEINKITAGRMDFIILRKPGTKRYKKYELHRIQGVTGDVAGIFWDTARDSSWVVDRMVTESREKVTSMFEYDIKKKLEKGYALDYFGSGLIIRLLGKRFN